MRTKISFAIAASLSLLSAGRANAQAPLGPAFTYQGELASAGVPASGVYDIRFRLYDAAAGGNQIGVTLCSDDMPVTNGRFAASLDFGASAFIGQERFLEIEVRQDSGLGCADASGYTLLAPRQELAAAPHATFASTAGFAESAASALNATQFGGQNPAFYTSAANLSSGTIDPARLPASTVRANISNAFGPSPNTFAGPLGIGTASPASLVDVVGFYRTGAANAIDQQQAIQNSFGAGTDLWQSFTAGQSGQLTRVEFNGASGVGGQSRVATIQIYAGEGIGGSLMATSTITLLDVGSGAWVSSSIPGQFLVVAGRQYTIRISITGSNIFLSASDANSYLGGRTNGPDFRDYVFRTFVTPATQTSMFNIGMNGVGIGTAAPAQLFHTAGPALFGGVENFAVGFDSQTAARVGMVKKLGSNTQFTAASTTPILFSHTNQSDIFTNISGATLTERLRIDPSGNVGINNNQPIQTLDVNGRIRVANGVIQRGNPAINATSDLGLYSLVDGQWMRMVTTNAPFQWFTEPGPDGIGLTPRMTLNASGLSVNGTLAKAGGSFKIDHPLDPENKYLYHSFVESPDMMNIYNGNVVTDADGYATITLPDYFEALNRDFRYQLTVLDTANFALARISREISGGTFELATNLPNVKVSWQVTGIRKDAWAEKNRIPNAVDKPAAEKGKYLHPEAFDKPTSRSVFFSPTADSPSASN